MANVATLTLVNGSAVNIPLDPETVLTGEKATWVDRAAVSYALTTRFFMGRKVSSSSQNAGKREVTCILKMPFPSASPGADPNLAGHTLIANITFTVPNQASLAERRDLWAAFKSSLNSAQIQSAVEDDEMPW